MNLLNTYIHTIETHFLNVIKFNRSKITSNHYTAFKPTFLLLALVHLDWGIWRVPLDIMC